MKACVKTDTSCTTPLVYGDTKTGTVGATSNLCGNTSSNSNFASVNKISIPAKGKIIVFSSAAYTSTTIGDGSFVLNLRTDSLQ